MIRSEPCQQCSRRKTADTDLFRIDFPFVGPRRQHTHRSLRVLQRRVVARQIRAADRRPIFENGNTDTAFVQKLRRRKSWIKIDRTKAGLRTDRWRAQQHAHSRVDAGRCRQKQKRRLRRVPNHQRLSVDLDLLKCLLTVRRIFVRHFSDRPQSDKRRGPADGLHDALLANSQLLCSDV